ncbi:hypothetical protein MTR67_036027, partial [Solanum verrucosum]
ERTENRTPSLQGLSLRYFTPREVFNSLQFCEIVLLRICILFQTTSSFHNTSVFANGTSFSHYAMLGNSLSVGVVAPLLQYLFTNPS